MPKSRIVLLLALSLLTGCGEIVVFGHTVREGRSEVKAVPQNGTTTAQATTTPATTDATTTTTKSVAAPAVAAPSVHAVRAVTLELTSQAAVQVANDPKFKADALLDAIKGELRSRKLFDDADSSANGTAEISIEEFSVQPASNAVLFGYVLSNGLLSGEVRLQDAAGNNVQRYRIQAKSRLSAPAEGESPNLLSPLYRRFAALTGDSVAGEPSKSSAAEQSAH